MDTSAARREGDRAAATPAGHRTRHRILVGTHHKTGTVLMRQVFTRIARQCGLRWIESSLVPIPHDEWDIAFDYHSVFPGLNPALEVRGVHLVRDPRMVVVSAAFYHRHSQEAWLHVPLEKFSGRTYQQAINALGSDRERFIFEMNGTSGGVIRAMDEWTRRRPRGCIDVKLENLMVEEGLETYFRLFRHLGFGGMRLVRCLAIAYEESLFNPRHRGSRHVRSARPEHWGRYYDAELLALFRDRFGDVCERLGYEA